MEHYGSNIERMRIMKGIEQTDIAGELGITQQAWSKLAKQPLIQEEMLEKNLKENEHYQRGIRANGRRPVYQLK